MSTAVCAAAVSVAVTVTLEPSVTGFGAAESETAGTSVMRTTTPVFVAMLSTLVNEVRKVSLRMTLPMLMARVSTGSGRVSARISTVCVPVVSPCAMSIYALPPGIRKSSSFNWLEAVVETPPTATLVPMKTR